MSIANVVTRGYGSFGSVAFIVTAGYFDPPDVVQLPSTILTGTATVTAGGINTDYNLEAATFVGAGQFSSDLLFALRPVRNRPLRSQAFNTRKR